MHNTSRLSAERQLSLFSTVFQPVTRWHCNLSAERQRSLRLLERLLQRLHHQQVAIKTCAPTL